MHTEPLMTEPRKQPPAKPDPPKHDGKQGGDLKHIGDTGLPPGISIEDAKDPGSQTPRTPADNRS
jgi:hypothetical protein